MSIGLSLNQISSNMILKFWALSRNEGFFRDMGDAIDMVSILFLFDPLMIWGLFYTSENPNVIFILCIKILFSME